MTAAPVAVLARRRAGVLLHVGSLQAGLGHGGRRFIDWLASAGFGVWQIGEAPRFLKHIELQ